MENERKLISEMLYKSRYKMGKSQEYMALEMGVARKTVQNWEKGVSEPYISQLVQCFEILGESPLPYILQMVYPDTMYGINASDSDHRVRESLRKIVEDLPPEGARQLLFLFYGDHGSSPRANLNMLTAHLQTPLNDRVTHATVIAKHYEMAKKRGAITDAEHIQPDMEQLRQAIERGEEAVIKNRERYY